MRAPVVWWIGLTGILLFGLGIGGCRPEPGPSPYVFGEAIVDAIEIDLLESLPLQVRARITGGLADACTEIHEIVQSRDGTTFRLRVITRRPADAICAQVITPFEVSIDLPVGDLPPGRYTVVAGDARAEFDLPSGDPVPDGGE